MKRFKEFLQEAPVQNIERLGKPKDWDQSKVYDKKSFESLKDPQFEANVKKAFKGIPDHDLNFYFINDEVVGDIDHEEFGGEQGQISDDDDIWNISAFKDKGYEAIADEDAIAIIFTGNYGSAAVKMTPWVLAHRIGHVFNASRKHNKYSGADYIMSSIEEQVVAMLNDVAEDYWIGGGENIFTPRKWISDEKQRKLASQILANIGTFASARNKKLDRPYEFIYEMFAQYTITGEIKFNTEPKPIVIESDEAEYGEPPDVYNYRSEHEWDLGSYERTFEYYMDELYSNAMGTVNVM